MQSSMNSIIRNEVAVSGGTLNCTFADNYRSHNSAAFFIQDHRFRVGQKKTSTLIRPVN